MSQEGVERDGTGERGTDPGGVVAASARIEGGRGARGSQKGVKGDEREVCHARPGVEGRSSPGQGYPPPRGFHPLAARQRAIYHWFRPTLLLLLSFILLILLRRCCTPLFYLPCVTIATAAANIIDPYSLLLRGTFARIVSGLAPRKSLTGTRVRVFL